jgi:DNA polymerase III delta prime subunit
LVVKTTQRPHVPRLIEENDIYQQLQTAEDLVRRVYEGRQPALIIYGPPGIGKTTLGEKVARQYGEPWRPERPGSKVGLIEILYKRRHGGVVPCDDIDGLWDNAECLEVLKVALDTKDVRRLSHAVSGKNAFKPFVVKCGVVFFSNRDFNNPAHFGGAKNWSNGIAAVKNRSLIAGLSFDPLTCYEYTGWLATEGGMLRNVSINLKPGSKIIGKNGQPTTVTKENSHRKLSLSEANDVLEHFAENAAHYPSIGPRELYKYARLRIGTEKARWERMVGQQLETEPKWDLPQELHQYKLSPTGNKPKAKVEPTESADVITLTVPPEEQAETAVDIIAKMRARKAAQGMRDAQS